MFYVGRCWDGKGILLKAGEFVKQKLAEVPGNVTITKGTANLPKASVVVVTQLATIDKSRLLGKIGTLPSPIVEAVSAGCQMVLARKVF